MAASLGIEATQGPHQVAQKSSNNGLPRNDSTDTVFPSADLNFRGGRVSPARDCPNMPSLGSGNSAIWCAACGGTNANIESGSGPSNTVLVNVIVVTWVLGVPAIPFARF